MGRKLFIVFITALLFLVQCSERAVYIPPKENRKDAQAPYDGYNGVVFTYFNKTVHTVTLVGDFNNWNPTRTSLKKNKFGVWFVSLPLEKGPYRYKYNVDGNWICDPNNSAIIIDRTTGDRFSLVEVGKTYDVADINNDFYGPSRGTSPYPTDNGIMFSLYNNKARRVAVAGTWNGWDWSADDSQLYINKNSVWMREVFLPRGRYLYRYYVDGVWCTDPENTNTRQIEYNETAGVLLVTNVMRTFSGPPKITEFIPVSFVYKDPSLNNDASVSVIGDFNNWDPTFGKLRARPLGTVWETVLYIRPGHKYYYRFSVNNAEVLDVANNKIETAPDGRDANYIEVFVPDGHVPVLFTANASGAHAIQWIGEYNHWDSLASPFIYDYANDIWVVVINLPEGEHSYRFRVDGKDVRDIYNYNVSSDAGGEQYSLVIIREGIDGDLALFKRVRKNKRINYTDNSMSFKDWTDEPYYH